MNREGAETYLRQLAEAELRRAMTLPATWLPAWRTARLALVTQALLAVNAIDAGTADQIRADLELAVAVRQPGQVRPIRGSYRRVAARASPRASPGQTGPAWQQASWRLVPLGRTIRIRGDARWELPLVAYVQSAGGARFTVAGRNARRLTVADDRGARYQIDWIGGPQASELRLRPNPPDHIRWLDLTPAPGEPATRIDLDPRIPAPDVTVTRNAHSPGELLLDAIAARILCGGAAFPQDDLEDPAPGPADLRGFVGGKPGDIVAALYASGGLPPASPVPGQLAALCERLGIPGHGISAPSATALPEPWRCMLTRLRDRTSQAAPGFLAATAVELPELDGARFAILGVHHDDARTIVHMLASGVTLEGDWDFSRGVRPQPVLWIRDSSGRWHATRTNGLSPSGTSGEVMLWLETVPPVDRGIARIDVVAAGLSAEVRVGLPLRRK